MYGRRRSGHEDSDGDSEAIRHNGRRAQGVNERLLLNDLEQYLHEIDMGHNFETLRTNGITSIEQLSHVSSETMKAFGILTGNALFIERYMQANPPAYGLCENKPDTTIPDVGDITIPVTDPALVYGQVSENLRPPGFDFDETHPDPTDPYLGGILNPNPGTGHVDLTLVYGNTNLGLWMPGTVDETQLEMTCAKSGREVCVRPIDHRDVFTIDDLLLTKYRLSEPYDNVKLHRHVGDFSFGTVWEVRHAAVNASGVPTGKYSRFGLKVQRGDPRAMKRGVAVWKRAIERNTVNVPGIFSTKAVGNTMLVLMEYTPAIPVDSAHKYLSKRYPDSQVKQKMREASGELLVMLAHTLQDLHSDDSRPDKKNEQIFHLGIHEDNILIKFDSVGNLSTIALIDFTPSKIRNVGDGNFEEEVSDDWNGLLFSFLKLYRNSIYGFGGAYERESEHDRHRDRIDQLKSDLKRSPYIGDIITEIGKVLSKSNAGKVYHLDALSEAARERDVVFRYVPKDITFAADGTVIGMKSTQPPRSLEEKAPMKEILFTGPFLCTGAPLTTRTIRNSTNAIPEDEDNQQFPKVFRGDISNGFSATKNDRQWRIQVKDHIFELYEEIPLESRHPRQTTPFLVLRIDARERIRSYRTSLPRKNVWYMSTAGVSGKCATFADVQHHGSLCIIGFQYCPDALEVADDRIDYEIDDPVPDSVLGVAIGWKLVRVNGVTVNGLNDINAQFRQKAPFQTIFVKAPRRRRTTRP